MPRPPSVDIVARLGAILSGIRRLRASLYPEGWDADPLLQVERDLAALLKDIQD